MTTRAWPIVLAGACGIAVLCSLGAWQVQRLGQKQRLIAELQGRMAQAPVPLADAFKRLSAGEDVEYLKVVADGALDVGHILKKQTSFKGMPAWEAIAPFKAVDGSVALVDLGVAAGESVATSKLLGILRLHNKGKGYFDNDNNAATNEWFWWDLPAMQKAAEISGPLVVVQSLQSSGGFEAAEAKVELSNNHLGYAITWFGLAAALAGVAGAFLLGKRGA
jgi:surfeit locus 1 family protein